MRNVDVLQKRRRKLRFGRTSSELFLESVQSPIARPPRHPHTAAAEAPVHQDEQRLPQAPAVPQDAADPTAFADYLFRAHDERYSSGWLALYDLET